MRGTVVDHPSTSERTTSSSSSESASSSSPSVSRCRAERAVRVQEMDAAKALADFAEIALLEREAGGGGGGGGVAAAAAAAAGGGDGRGGEWGNTARRSSKRVSPCSLSATAVEGGKLEKSAAAVHVSGLPRFSFDLNQNAVSEEEQRQELKDKVVEDRMQPQMNSELGTRRFDCSSSRLPFTIGRAKPDLTEALCEELTRKAVELSLENEKMRREKENAMKEYLLLNDTNKRLKEKMEERTKNEASTEMEFQTPASSCTKHPMVMHHRLPFMQLAYPSNSCSLDPNETHSNSVQTNPSNKEGIHGIPVSGIYVPPYLWFYPVIQQQQQHQQHGSSMSACAQGETGDDVTTMELEKEERNNINAKSTQLIAGIEQDLLVGVASSLGVDNLSSDVKTEDLKCDQPIEVGRSLKKVVDSAAAAEARKKRKELTKLKRQHGREFDKMYSLRELR